MLEEKKEIEVEEKPDLTGLYAGNTITFVGLLIIIADIFQMQTGIAFICGWILIGIGTLIRQLRAIYLKLYED